MTQTVGDDPVLVAAVKMLGRTGAASFSVRYVEDPGGSDPVAWVALASYAREQGTYWEAAGGMTPKNAVLRLCETVIDGGICLHCQRPTGFEPDSIDTMPADSQVCWYQFDPEMKMFRRGCEGSS